MIEAQTEFVLIEQKHITEYLKRNKCKPLSKKQLAIVFELIDHNMQHAQLKGFNDGKKTVTSVNKEQMRVDLSISIQRLVDSNAQLAQCISHALTASK